MNILIVCHFGMYRDFSSSFVHAQAKAYAALGHRVRAVIPIATGKGDWDGKRMSSPPQKREIDGVELFPVRYLSISKYGEARFNTASALRAVRNRLAALLDGFAPDVIHAHTLGFDSEIGAWLKERLGIPLVVTTHGSDTSIPVERGQAASLKPYCDRADAVVAVSSALAGKVHSCGTLTPISVILNGFNVHDLPERQERERLSLIQAGNLQEQKRPGVTLRAFAALRRSYPDATLCFVGQGPERSRLESMSRELGVSCWVRFTGQLPNPDVLAELSRARFFILPSVREGFGIVYLEAMACGCVTIGTEGEGIADLIVSGKNGFLVPLDDPDAIVRAVEWCLGHPEETAVIAEKGRRDALSLTWEKNAAEYTKLFKELRHGN